MRSVQRAVELLALFEAEHPSRSVRELVDATGLPKTTVVRLVHTLEQCGLLWSRADGRLVPGTGLLRWAELAGRTWRLPEEGLRLLQGLSEASHGETVHLYVRQQNTACASPGTKAPAVLSRSVGILAHAREETESGARIKTASPAVARRLPRDGRTRSVRRRAPLARETREGARGRPSVVRGRCSRGARRGPFRCERHDCGCLGHGAVDVVRCVVHRAGRVTDHGTSGGSPGEAEAKGPRGAAEGPEARDAP